MATYVKNNYNSELLVLLVEEYGYRHWFWFPQMSVEELEDWWTKLETVEPYFMTPEPLPGVLYQVKSDDEYNFFDELKKSSKYYISHIHCDDDSVLISANKTKLFHKGYEEK